jgi:hypothetical protein
MLSRLAKACAFFHFSLFAFVCFGAENWCARTVWEAKTALALAPRPFWGPDVKMGKAKLVVFCAFLRFLIVFDRFL